MELFYLYPQYFKPDIDIVKSYNIDFGRPYFIVRFVAWNASHDIGQKGLSYQTKIDIVEKLKKYGTVLISSEGKLPEELSEYQIKINPAHLHHFLAFASLYIGEGSTTASECAVLGTPNIYVNSLVVGYCKEQEEKYELCYQISDVQKINLKIDSFIENDFSRTEYEIRRRKMLSEKIDGTAFLVWFVENYPKSEKIMREKPDYQFNFK
jgi:predicted glycosyltransferase